MPPTPGGRRETAYELLARFRARYRGDYVGFTRLLEINARTGRRGLELNAIQRKYDADRTPRDVCLKARRCGMTTEAIARDLWSLLCTESPSVGIVCQSGKDHPGAVAVRRILDPMLEALEARGLPLLYRKHTSMRLELDCGDWVATLDIIEAGASLKAAEKAGRSERYTRLHCTEQSYWEYGGSTMAALRHCVAPAHYGTEIQIESTANGLGAEHDDPKDQDGAAMFHTAVLDAGRGVSGYRLHFYAWFEDPENALPGNDNADQVLPRTDRERWLVDTQHIAPAQLRWYQAQLAECKSQALLDQEAPSDPDTCFMVSGRAFFDLPTLQVLLQGKQAPIAVRVIRDSGARGQQVGGLEVPALRVWQHPKPGCYYVVICDSSEGTGGDAGSAIVYERGTGRHCATLWGQFRPRRLAALGKWLAEQYNHAELVVERNNHGGTVLAALEAEHRYTNVYEGPDTKPGFNTTPASRPVVLDTFEEAVRQGHFRTDDPYLLGEMRTFVMKKSGKFEAKGGNHDDLVMPAAIGWWVICHPMRVRRAGGASLPVA